MTKINLRSYNREIETLIDQGKIDLAIAHSLHVLKYFPKHVDTYRLLGKAYLENQRLGDAADVFQRVLSAVPDDFVSHIGMSIIREDEGNLDASIWHMQRAYDVQSSNVTIQDELRRLYDKRDGIEPPKIRLTRAALARMYARGDLINEAITELRSALQEEPDRADLLVLLARMYYANQQRVKSIQTCSQVLNKLPYCLDANLIISQALTDTNRAEEAQTYQDRAKELDPYAAYLSENAPTVGLVPDAAVTLTKMDETDFLTGTASAQPAWVASLGEKMPETEVSEDDSDWLFEDLPADETHPEETEDAELADTLAETEAFQSTGQPTESAEEVEAAAADDFETTLFGELDDEADAPIPDWMQEAGWQSRDPEQPENPPEPISETDFDETAPGEENLTPADIPDWLQAMAPKELNADTAPQAALPDEPTEEETAAQEIPDWLQDLTEEDATIIAEPAAEKTGKAETIPDWLLDEEDLEETLVPQEDMEEEEIPDWLRDLAMDAEEETTQAAEATGDAGAMELEEATEAFDAPVVPADTGELQTEPQEALPDWLQDMEEEEEEEEEEAAPVEADEMAQDWLASLELQDEPAEEEQEEELPDWLLDIADEGEETTSVSDRTGVTLWLRRNAEVEDGELSFDEEDAESAEFDMEELLADETVLEETSLEEETAGTEPVSLSTESEETIQTDRPAELSEAMDEERAETPSWLQGLDEELLSEAPEEASEEAEMPDLDDAEATFRWLESLAARQGAKEEELLSSPEERTGEPPEWIRSMAESGAEGIEEETAEDDWLAELSAEDIPESEIAESPVEADTLDWGDIEKEVETTPETEAEAAEEDLSWLEELTIEEGEEEFLVQPEETVEDTPAWPISPTVEEEDIPEWLKGEIEEAEAATESEELPEWLQKVDGDEEPESEPAEDELPEWPGVEDEEAAEEIVPESEEEVQEIYAWQQEETVIEEPVEAEEEAVEEAEAGEVWWQRETGPLDPSVLPESETEEIVEAVEEPEPVEEFESPQEEEEEEAVAELQPAAIEDRPEVPALAAARAALESGDVSKALDHYRKAIRRKHHLEEIIADLDEALQYNHPVNIEIWTALGDAYARDDQLQNALDAYTKAEELLK